MRSGLWLNQGAGHTWDEFAGDQVWNVAFYPYVLAFELMFRWAEASTAAESVRLTTRIMWHRSHMKW